MREDGPTESLTWRERLPRALSPKIRIKIIFPYLILTLVVAVIGTYVVTNLVSTSLDERLVNHLLESGRVVSETLVRWELDHMESGRLIAYTRGVIDALEAGDHDTVAELVKPAAVGLGAECVIMIDADSNEALHLLAQEGSTLAEIGVETNAPELWIVQSLLTEGNPEALPRRGIGVHPLDGRYYYFTAITVGLDQVVGVVVMGTSLDTLLPELKETALADITIYAGEGHPIGTTFELAVPDEEAESLLTQLTMPEETYEESLYSDDYTIAETIDVNNRAYRIARGPLMVGEERLGVFSVALPSDFIFRAGMIGRNTYAIIFGAAMAAVILLGFLVARIITNPLNQLVKTSRAVAEGNLGQRTGIESSDEIGLLATTFDEMTERLEERTRALESLLHTYQEASGRLRAILLSIGDGVLLVDLDGNLAPLNPAAEVLLEEMAHSVQADSLRELIFEDDTAPRPAPWQLERRHLQVGKRVISVHSADVRTDTNERLGTVIVLRDVTAEFEAERLKDAFVAHVSHELRTPLTSIKGYSSILSASAADVLDEQQQGFLTIINRHTDNLIMMIDELLDFSEMEAKGTLGIQRESIVLADFVTDISDEWRPKMDDKELTFELDIPPSLPIVEADSRRLRWAIINLVRNAWQYTPSGGAVTIQPTSADEYVILKVSDTGVGMTSEEQQQIFNRFYRPLHEEDDDVRGLGLGLYVTQAIIEAHGGELVVESEKGVGSAFSLVLPISQVTENE
jgi:signal transduction histidine kinase